MRLSDLMESSEYLLLESPQRAAWLLKTFGEKLKEKFETQYERLPEVVYQAVLAQPPQLPENVGWAEGEENIIGEKLVNYMMAADPTTNKSYSQWIVLRYLKNDQRLEDINANLSNMLGLFQRATQSKRLQANIDQIKTFSDLYAVLEPFIRGDREVSGKADRKAGRQTLDPNRLWNEKDPMREQADVLLDDDAYMVLIPKTAQAAAYFGKNTNWCTTSSMFHHYHEQGPLYIILRRRDGRRWQFHFESGQFMNEQDRSIDLDEFLDENPEVFQAIGPDKFVPLLSRRGRSEISARHFTPEIRRELPTAVLAQTARTLKDIKQYAKEDDRVYTVEFFDGLAPRLREEAKFIHDFLERKPELTKDELKASKEVSETVKLFAKKLGKPTIDKVMQTRDHFWMLRELPEGFIDDSLKSMAAFNLAGNHTHYQQWEYWIPKPWPENVQEKFWRVRIMQNPRGTDPNDVPEQFRDVDDINTLLMYHGEEIPQFLNYIDRLYVERCTSTLIATRDFYYLESYIGNLPERFLTASLMQQLITPMRTLAPKADEAVRDQFLRIMAKFPHDLWPMKAKATVNRMALTSTDFMANPEQFHTEDFAVQWLEQNPTLLHTLPREFITPKGIKASLSSSFSSSAILDKCDPKVVDPDMVAEVLVEKPQRLKFWLQIPEAYLTHRVLVEAARQGAIPPDNPNFPPECLTTKVITTYFSKNFTMMVVDEKEVERLKKQGYWGFRPGQEPKRFNKEGFEHLWRTLPEASRRSSLVAEMVTSLTPNVVTAVPKRLLNSKVLDAFAEKARRYADVDYVKLLKAFPESAYTKENVHLLVKNGVLDKAPEHLETDDVLVAALTKWSSDAVKKLNWDRVTVAHVRRAVEIAPRDLCHVMEFYMPKNHPAMRDPVVAARLMRGGKGTGIDFQLDVDLKDVRKLYSDHPERWKDWDQTCYDLGAGWIVPLDKVPERFRSETVMRRAIETNPESITLMPNAAEWLNRNSSEIESVERNKLSRYGFVYRDGKWIDGSKTERETLPGAKGSYLIGEARRGGKTLVIFDQKGKPIDSFIVADHDPQNYDHSPNLMGSDYPVFASKDTSRQNDVSALVPYRTLIAAALKKLPFDNHSSLSSLLRKLFIYSDWQKKKYLSVEEWPRTKVDEDISYCAPDPSSYGGKKYFLFDGQEGPLLLTILLEPHGGNNRFEDVKVRTSLLPRIIEATPGIATFLARMDVASGNNPKFLNSILNRTLGIKGPGRGVWFALCDEEIGKVGSLRAWRHDRNITFSDDEGILYSVELKKNGKGHHVMIHSPRADKHLDAINVFIGEQKP